MKKILMTTLLLLSASGYASQINVQALEACSLVENDLKRLMCYDKIMKNEKPHKAQKENKAHLNKQAKVPNNTRDDEFGLENRVEHKVDHIRSEIVTLKLPKVGSKTVTLENGQIWKLTDVDVFRAKVGDSVVIKRAALGSFLMNEVNSKRAYRVKRLK